MRSYPVLLWPNLHSRVSLSPLARLFLLSFDAFQHRNETFVISNGRMSDPAFRVHNFMGQDAAVVAHLDGTSAVLVNIDELRTRQRVRSSIPNVIRLRSRLHIRFLVT